MSEPTDGTTPGVPEPAEHPAEAALPTAAQPTAPPTAPPTAAPTAPPTDPAEPAAYGAYVAPGAAPASAPEAPARSGDLLGGVLAGVIAAVVGAALWALVVAVTHYEIGLIAVVVGWGVGYAVHRFGGPASVNLAAVAAVLAAIGILAGFVLGSLVPGAHDLGGGFFDAVDFVSSQIGWGTFITQSVGGVGWLFLAIGAFGAFRLVAQQRRT